MTNTIMTAKNTWSDGLVMDFSPDNTQSSCLTSALNATILTFNGNEMSLQNDMGNARVESAYLPEGYIPVGTCEFGDIIYIVSYNPLINKSLIGCFPSPERNISSDEVSDISLSISSSEFLELMNGLPTGKLVATSVKKLLFENKFLNPGDKYIIYSNSLSLQSNSSSITDYGNKSHIYGNWPKIIKIHVISIEDSGKITYLDSSLKWYSDINYYLTDLRESLSGIPDIDSYRNLTSSAYSIFQNKNAGLLAVLAELEQITGFNCAYSVIPYLKEDDLDNLYYNIYLHTSWTTDSNDVNPCGLAILDSLWVGTDGGKYRIAQKLEKNWVYGELLGPLERPINNPGYDIKKELGRIYHLENKNTDYNSYIGDLSISPDLRRIPEDNHSTSYNYYITSDHTNYNVGWPEDGNKELRDVTRITQAKTDDGKYLIDTYYFNLDGFEILEDKKKIAKTRGINNKLYTSSNYCNNDDGTGKVKLSPDIVNNYFKKDVTVELLSDFSLPLYSSIDGGILLPVDNSNFIWKIKVAPCMPYGVLEQYATDLIIDFSKVGKDSSNLTLWKYINLGEVLTLSYGLDINLANNKLVKEVTFDFYDNLGIAATYKSLGKTSYSGIFTELFGLNGNNTNYKLGTIDSNNKPIYHAGLSYVGELSDRIVYWDGENKPDLAKEGDNGNLYINDAGTLYANFLYKVDIRVIYGVVDELGEFIDSTILESRYSRWIWTNSMYNDYYYNTADFDVLPLQLDLGYSYRIKSNSNYLLKQDMYYNSSMSAESNNIPLNSLGATVTHINLNELLDGNINIGIDVGLLESYKTLYLIDSESSKLTAEVRLGKASISTDSILIVSEYGNVSYDSLFPLLDKNIGSSGGKLNNIGPKLSKLLYDTDTNNGLDIWDDPESYKNYIDTFSLDFSNKYSGNISNDNFTYSDPTSGEIINTSDKLVLGGDTISNLGFDLTLTGISFIKLCFGNNEPFSGNYPRVLPIIRSLSTRDMLNISWDSSLKTFYFNRVLGLSLPDKLADKKGGGVCWRDFSSPNSSGITDSITRIAILDYAYNSDSLLEALDKKRVDSPLVLVCWSHWEAVHRLFLEPGNLKIPTIPEGDNDKGLPLLDGDWSKLTLYLLFLNKSKTSFYPLHDICGIQNNGSLTLISKRMVPNRNLHTLANLVASMLALIYYLTSETTEYLGFKFSNLCFPSKYLETWRRHILVTISAPSEGTNSYIALSNGLRFSEYLSKIDNIFPKNVFNKEASNNNINSQLLSTTLIIDFLYQIPYTEILLNKYRSYISSISSLLYYGGSSTPIPSENSYSGSLYIKDGNELKPLTGDFTYSVCTWKWGGEEDYSDLLIDSTSTETYTVKNLGQLILYSPSLIFEVRRYPPRNLYNIGTGEDKDGKTLFRGASLDAEFTKYYTEILKR